MRLQNQIFENFSTNPKIQILDIFHGSNAVKKAEILFFKNDHSTAKDWSKQWNTNQKRNALLLVYQWTARNQKHFGFKLVIGDNMLGEKYRTTSKDNQFLETINKYY